MKLIKNIYLTVLVLLCICSCTDKELVNDIPVSSSGVTVSLKVSGTNGNFSRATGETVTSKESTIGNVYLLFYEDDGEIFAEPKVFIKRENLKNVGSWNDNIELQGLLQGQEYNVYAFANLPESSSGNLSEFSTRGAVLELVETLDKARNKQGSEISFATVSSYTGGQSLLSIDVIRTVARIESKIDMSNLDDTWIIESVNVLNERDKVTYLGSEPSDVSRVSSYDAFLAGVDSLYYYTYENPASANEDEMLKLRINLNQKNDTSIKRSYTALVAKKFDGELKRNTIYRSKIILSEKKDPVVIDLSAEWVDTNIDIVIPSAIYMDFPTDSIILTERGWRTYDFKSNADSIYIKWENMPNLSISPFRTVKEGYIYPSDLATGIYKLNMSMSASDENEEKGKITFTTGNLIKEMGIRRPGAAGKLSFTVLPFDTGNIPVYELSRDQDEKITMTFEGLMGVTPWYRIQRLRFISASTGKDNDMSGRETDLRTYFSSETMELRIGDIPYLAQGTWYLQLELGTANNRYSPASKVIQFMIEYK